jgi:hypothetical protein
MTTLPLRLSSDTVFPFRSDKLIEGAIFPTSGDDPDFWHDNKAIPRRNTKTTHLLLLSVFTSIFNKI